jgi:hypothetical protein
MRIELEFRVSVTYGNAAPVDIIYVHVLAPWERTSRFIWGRCLLLLVPLVPLIMLIPLVLLNQLCLPHLLLPKSGRLVRSFLFVVLLLFPLLSLVFTELRERWKVRHFGVGCRTGGGVCNSVDRNWDLVDYWYKSCRWCR